MVAVLVLDMAVDVAANVFHSPRVLADTNFIGSQSPYNAPAFKAGSRTSRELANWRPKAGSVDDAALEEKELINGRAQDIVRNNGFAAGAVRTSKDSTVGHRYKLVLLPDHQTLSVDRDVMRVWANGVERRWESYATDPEGFIDAARQKTFVEILRCVDASEFVTGDAFIAREYRADALKTDSNFEYGTCFSVLDPERISDPSQKPQDKEIRLGCEVDLYGAVDAYHVKYRDRMMSNVSGGQNKWQRIPRYSGAMLNMIHIFESERGGMQTRGVSRFAPIIQKLKMIDRIEDAELEATILSAIMPMYIKSDYGAASAFNALGGDGGANIAGYMEAQASFSNASPMMYDGLRVPHLFTGESLETVKSDHPNSVLGEFTKNMIRHFVRGVGGSYSAYSGDYTNTSFSALRGEKSDQWQQTLSRRSTTSEKAATLMFRAWLDELITREIVALPPGINDYWQARSLLTRCMWIGSSRPVIDEVKAATANKINYEMGFTSLRAIYAEMGIDLEEGLDQRQEEDELLKQRSLGNPQQTATNVTFNNA
jgi:lambda family phage portal protein